MKKLIILLASTSILLLAESCSVISPITQTVVSVSFASECCGPNPQAEEALLQFLEKDKISRGFAVLYFDTRWGREGEYNRCFPLVELDPLQKQVFITSLRQQMKGYRLVTVSGFCSPRG